ncbi:MAG TPA: hypothetical protein VHO03_04710 [Ignavibacteriales bacterium]|nr:hypothetical protein [Ignavibacteriales bacterium]
MEQSELFEQVTALADNEIKDEAEIKLIRQLIHESEALQKEFQIQLQTKSSLRTRFGSAEAPAYLKERIISHILQEIPLRAEPIKKEFPGKESPIKIKKKSWFLRPQFAFASLIAAVILAVVFFFRSYDAGSIASRQSGMNNMFLKAKKNFQSVVDGTLPLEAAGGSSAAVMEYFRKKGVKFQPVVPQAKDWDLIGAVVSDDNGEKLPHNVYRGKDGKLVYLYQADEECLKKKQAVTLSKDLISMLDEGKSYKYSDNGRNYMVWKDQGNICVLVSNDSMQKLESSFLAAGK